MLLLLLIIKYTFILKYSNANNPKSNNNNPDNDVLKGDIP